MVKKQLMMLALILPLTYREIEQKMQSIQKIFELAKEIEKTM